MSQVRTITDDREVFALLNLFKEIAAEQGWQPGNWLEASPETASYLSVMHEGRLAGGVQIVFPDEQAYLPYQSVWPEVSVCNPLRTAHVTILALAQEFRGKQGIFWSLCIEIWRLCVAREVETVILEATPHMLEKYRKLRWPLEPVGELRKHWGEECCLCRMDMRMAAGAMIIQAQRSESYRALVEKASRSLQKNS